MAQSEFRVVALNWQDLQKSSDLSGQEALSPLLVFPVTLYTQIAASEGVKVFISLYFLSPETGLFEILSSMT